jgi:putative FmdB family regulatory protein
VPLYEYECEKCHKRTEKIEGVKGPHLKKCPHCGGKVEQLVSAPAIQFKGSGWYVTDYAGKKSAGGESSTSGKSETKDSGKDSGKESPSKDSGSKESGAKESSGKESSSKDSGGKESSSKESKGKSTDSGKKH